MCPIQTTTICWVSSSFLNLLFSSFEPLASILIFFKMNVHIFHMFPLALSEGENGFELEVQFQLSFKEFSIRFLPRKSGGAPGELTE